MVKGIATVVHMVFATVQLVAVCGFVQAAWLILWPQDAYLPLCCAVCGCLCHGRTRSTFCRALLTGVALFAITDWSAHFGPIAGVLLFVAAAAIPALLLYFS